MQLNIVDRINICDNYILNSIKKYLQNKYLDVLMPIVTFMGSLGFVWITIAVYLMLYRQYRMIGNVLIITLAISTSVGEGIIKHIVKRARPCNYQDDINMLISRPSTYSFPSGHTLSSFAAAEMLSMYFSPYKLIFIGIAVLIAFSRLYLYVHYPSDIIAGIIIGTLCSRLIFITIQEGYLLRFDAFFKYIMKG